MNKIKFGTDGWRAIIAEDFTVQNVERVSMATAIWLKNNFDKPSVTLGNDCRFAGKLFIDAVARVMASEGILVKMCSNEFVSTPMISLATVELKTSAGIIITASHNPPSYNGFKIKADFGGPAIPSVIAAIEDLIPDTFNQTTLSVDAYEKQGLITYVDMEEMYFKHVEKSFDLDAIKNSGLNSYINYF